MTFFGQGSHGCRCLAGGWGRAFEAGRARCSICCTLSLSPSLPPSLSFYLPLTSSLPLSFSLSLSANGTIPYYNLFICCGRVQPGHISGKGKSTYYGSNPGVGVSLRHSAAP